LTIEKWDWDGGSGFSYVDTFAPLNIYNTGGLAGIRRGTSMAFYEDTLYIGSRHFDYLHIERWSYDGENTFADMEYLGDIHLNTATSNSGIYGTCMHFVDNNLYIGTLYGNVLTIQKWIWDGDTGFELDSIIANLSLLNMPGNMSSGTTMSFTENYAYFGIRASDPSDNLIIERWEWDGYASFSNPVTLNTITLPSALENQSQGTGMSFYPNYHPKTVIPEPLSLCLMAVSLAGGILRLRKR
jgi:hypothetical protein